MARFIRVGMDLNARPVEGKRPGCLRHSLEFRIVPFFVRVAGEVESWSFPNTGFCPVVSPTFERLVSESRGRRNAEPINLIS